VPLPEAAPPAPPPAPSDGEEETLRVPRLPLASCEEAVEALSGLRRARPQPAAPPPQHHPGPADPRAGQPRPGYEPRYRYGPEAGPRIGETAPRFDDTGIVRHGPGMGIGARSGSRKRLAAAVGAFALAGVGLLGWRLVPHGGKAPAPKPSTSVTAPARAGVSALRIVDAQVTSRDEHADTARNTIGGGPDAWTTAGYFQGPKLAPYKVGIGIVYDLGTVRTVDHVEVSIGTPGATLELRAGDPDVTSIPVIEKKSPVGFTVVATEANVAGTGVTLAPGKAVRTRFVLVWFTALPQQADLRYRDSITQVKIFGSM
jgi:hypothetical protein